MMLISHKDTSALLADRLTASPAAGAHPFQMPAAPFRRQKGAIALGSPDPWHTNRLPPLKNVSL